MPGTTNMISPTGEAVEVPDEALRSAVNAGYRQDTPDEAAARAIHQGDLNNVSGTAQAIKAGALGALRIASLGLTDVAYGDGKELSLLKEAHPTATTIGETAALFAGPEGTLSSGVSKIGRGLAETAEGAGALAKATAAVKGAAFEGAAFNAGSYISDVALGDRDLSAEGFLGAVGKGALWGGGAGGVLHGVESGFVAARRLFPRSAVGDRGAVEVAEHDVANKLSDAADAGAELRTAARKRIDDLKYSGEQVKGSATGAVYKISASQAVRRAETDTALRGLANEHAAATDLVAGVPAEVQQGVSAAQDAMGVSPAHYADTHAAISSDALAADAAADAAREALHGHVESTLSATSADVNRISAMADEVATREQAVRDLLKRQGGETSSMDALALPPSSRADLAQAYDDHISRAAGSASRFDTEAALHDAAGVEDQIFHDALQSGGDQAKRAEEILAARGEKGIDSVYSASRRLERHGTSSHLPATEEISRGLTDQGPPSLEDLLRATKSNIDKGEVIGGMAARHGGRFVGDANEAVEVIGGYEKAVADLARELGPAAPAKAQELGAAYDAAIDASTVKQAKQMAQSVDDAALNVAPGRMTKDQVRAYRERLSEKVAANDIKSGRSTTYQGDGAGRIINGERRSMFTRRGVTPLDAEGRAMPDVLAGMTAEERAAQRASITSEQATRQLWRGSVMERLLTGKETLAEVEKLSGRKLSLDEIIDASREQHLGVIDEGVESTFRNWWHGDRAPIAKETLEAKLGRPVVDDEVAAARTAKEAKAEAKQQAASSKSATESRVQDRAAAALATPKVHIPSGGYGRLAEEGHGGMGAARRAESLGMASGNGAPRASRLGSLGKKAQDIATALQAARSLGIPGLPDPSAIPVVGPLLGLYLKARAARAVWSRMGGRIPETIEARIAGRAAATRDAVASAVDKALGVGETVAKASRSPAARLAPNAIDALSATLYPGEKPAPKPETINLAAAMRAEELARAVADPEGVKAAIRAAVPTQDPDLAEAIASATMRKLAYLQSKAPPLPPPDPMRREPSPVSTADATRFARIVRAVDDPAEAIRNLTTITADAADAIRNVYPQLFAQVQQRVVTQAAQMGTAVPYRTRVRLSVLFGAPMDASIMNLATLQQDTPPAPPALGMGQGGGPMQPPAPSVANPPNLVALYQTSADRRAAK